MHFSGTLNFETLHTAKLKKNKTYTKSLFSKKIYNVFILDIK